MTDYIIDIRSHDGVKNIHVIFNYSDGSVLYAGKITKSKTGFEYVSRNTRLALGSNPKVLDVKQKIRSLHE